MISGALPEPSDPVDLDLLEFLTANRMISSASTRTRRAARRALPVLRGAWSARRSSRRGLAVRSFRPSRLIVAARGGRCAAHDGARARNTMPAVIRGRCTLAVLIPGAAGVGRAAACGSRRRPSPRKARPREAPGGHDLDARPRAPRSHPTHGPDAAAAGGSTRAPTPSHTHTATGARVRPGPELLRRRRSRRPPPCAPAATPPTTSPNTTPTRRWGAGGTRTRLGRRLRPAGVLLRRRPLHRHRHQGTERGRQGGLPERHRSGRLLRALPPRRPAELALRRPGARSTSSSTTAS